jgi:hypothetical protein
MSSRWHSLKVVHQIKERDSLAWLFGTRRICEVPENVTLDRVSPRLAISAICALIYFFTDWPPYWLR